MNNQWWLRTQDETFGPVTRDNLLEWARMGRIQPGQDVSSDGENWIAATDVDFLDMRWSIDIGDGLPRGPFNKHAAQALLASGRLPQGSRLVEVENKERASAEIEPEHEEVNSVETVCEEVQSPVEEPGVTDDLKQQLEKLQAGLYAAEARAKEAEERALAAEARAKEADARALDAEAHAEDEIKRLPPTAQMAADVQAAVYALMRDEADELAAALDEEQKEAERFRQYRRERTERLLARRQEILKHIGTDAEDMTRRALIAHPEDPRTTHMRQELDALRILQERSALEADRKVRDLSAKLRDSLGETKRLREQVADVTVIYRQLQEVREKLASREKELMDERQRAEAERQQHAASQQALLARLSSLEMGMPGTTNQSREAHTVRLAPWMGLKK